MRALTLSMDQSIYEFTVSYLEAAAILDVVQWEEVGHYGVGGVSMKGSFDPSPWLLPMALLVVPGLHEVSSLVPPHDVLLRHSQKKWGSVWHALEVRARFKLSSSKVFLSGMLP